MKRIQDKKGWLTAAVCFLLLFCYHMSRDGLITALPKLSNTTYGVYYPEDIKSLEIDFDDSPFEIDYTTLPSVTINENVDSSANESRGHLELDYNKIAGVILASQQPLSHIERREKRRSLNLIESARFWSDVSAQDDRDRNIRSESLVRGSRGGGGGPLYSFNALKRLLVSDGTLRIYDTRSILDDGRRHSSNYIEDNVDDTSGWSGGVQSSILSVLHACTILGLFLGHYCIEASNVGEGAVGAVFALQWGVLVLGTQMVSLWGPIALGGLRLYQGIVQGAIYPCVYRLLEARALRGRIALGVVFSGSWLGTAVGTGLGSLDNWWVPFYASGTLILLLTVLLVALAPGTRVEKHGARCGWRQVLRRDVVVCALTHCSCAWLFHTLLLAPTVLQPYNNWYALVTVSCGFGVSSCLMALITNAFVPSKTQPARGFLLAVTTIGLFFSVASLVLVSTGEGLGGSQMLGLSLGAMCGLGITSSGYRLVLEAVPHKRRSRMMVLVNCAGALGAVFATSLLPSLEWLDEGTEAVGRGGYMSACLLPLSLVIASATCVFIFLIFPKSKKKQGNTNQEPSVYVIPVQNGAAGGDVTSQRSLDNKSFRSFKSAVSSASFRTAVSRTRASSFNTVMEDVEADMHSLDGSAECHSIKEQPEDEVYSLNSGDTAYRSMTTGHHLDTQASYTDLLESGDRTSAWLQLYHQVDLTRVNTGTTKQLPLPGLLI